MTPDFDFDAIRPYSDEEVQAVIQKLSQRPSFQALMHFFFPHWEKERLTAVLSGIQTIDEFQGKIIHQAFRAVFQHTISDIGFTGFDQLDPARGYLFVSNHRDIILDPAILNVFLFEHNFRTTQIAIGDNLLFSRLVTHLMKLNKSFIVHREGPPQLLYQHSVRLSAYIRQLINNDISVWIAQRSGRTKDGNDLTQPGLFKMFRMSGRGDFKADISSLNIVPLAISYEYEPCAGFKAQEMHERSLNPNYTKSREEDKKSMIRGIRASKGRIHLAASRLDPAEISALAGIKNKNQQLRELALVIDRHIYKAYKLWPSNYVACDLLSGKRVFEQFYSPEEEQAFRVQLEEECSLLSGDLRQLKKRILGIYARPVANAMQLEK